jgi:type VI protein secretion system component VasF
MSSIDFKLLLTSVCSFSIALAWNNAVSKAIDHHYPANNEVTQYMIYALAITVLVILFLLIVNRFSSKSGGILVQASKIANATSHDHSP